MKRFSYSMILAAAVSLSSFSIVNATTLDLSGRVCENQVAIDEVLSHQEDLTSLTMH